MRLSLLKIREMHRNCAKNGPKTAKNGEKMTPNGENSTKNAEKSPKRGENSMENSVLAEIVHLMAVARCVFLYKKNVDFQKKKKNCFIFFTNKPPKKTLKTPKKQVSGPQNRSQNPQIRASANPLFPLRTLFQFFA
jgi:hypothetical protein